MEKSRAVTILKNTMGNYFRHIVLIATFLILTPFVKNQLGVQRFGLWSLVQAVVAFFALADLGFAVGVVKFIADARGRQDPERLRRLTATLFWVYVALGTLVFLVALGLTPFLPRFLDLPAAYARDASIAFLLIASRAALEMPLGMFRGVMTGFQKQRWASMIRAGATVLYALLAWWALSEAPSLSTLGWVFFGAYTFTNIITMALAMCLLKGVSLSPRMVEWRLVREVWAFARFIFLVQISMMIAVRVDALIANWFLSLEAVAFYSVAARVSEKASGFCRQFSTAVTPMIAELKGAAEVDNIQAVLKRGATLAIAMATPLLMGLCWFARPLLVAWMGPEFAASAIPCQILLAAAMLSVMNSSFANVLSMTGYQRFLAYAVLFGQMLNFGLTILFVTTTQLGLPGVALATLISILVAGIGLMGHKAGKLYNFGRIEFFKVAVWPSVPASALMFGGIWLAERWLPASRLLNIAALELVGCLVFGLAFLFIGLNRADRNYYLSRVFALVRRKSGKPAPEEDAE